MATSGPAFGAGRLFLADSRLLLLILNEARHRGLHRVFGTSREQANLLTFVVALAAADATAAGVRRLVPVGLGLSGANAAMGGIAAREAAFAIGGPGSREVPNFAALVALAMATGTALPALLRAIADLRAAERRVRLRRIDRYRAAIQASGLIGTGERGAESGGRP
jgi:hypothetical protein